MAWQIRTPLIGATPIANRDTTESTAHPMGTVVEAYDSTYGVGKFMYVGGVASCAIRNWLGVNQDDFSTTRATADGVYSIVGTAMATLTASYYGWIQISGKTIGSCLTGYADNGKVYLTGTAGSVDDTSVAGDQVVRAKGASATTVDSGVADFEIEYAWTNNGIDGK